MEDLKHINAIVVAVSKFREQREIEALKKEGFNIFAENRVQELVKKAKENPDVTWHLIGHLQTNKVKETIRYASLIHSVDSIRLLSIIDSEAKRIDKIQEVLIQVNIAKEPQKFGIEKEEFFDFLNQAKSYQNIIIMGIMVIAPKTDDVDLITSVFTQGKELFDQMKKEDNINPVYLSMGMSNDYEIALKCGANMIRLGRRLFDSIK